MPRKAQLCCEVRRFGKPRVPEFYIVRKMGRVGVIGAGFQQQYRSLAVCRQSAGQHASGGPAADDHYVVLHAVPSLSDLLRIFVPVFLSSRRFDGRRNKARREVGPSFLRLTKRPPVCGEIRYPPVRRRKDGAATSARPRTGPGGSPMLPPKENELITRVGPGTPMGNAMRRYWIPACMSSEIAEPDSPPVRVKLLGEDLVAFRDSDGRIGLVDEFCPHRRVSLYLRAQRGMRAALRLSRLEIRRRRQLPRPAQRAAGEPVQAAHPPHRLSDRRAGRPGVGLSRPGRQDAAGAEIRLDPGARKPPACLQGHPGMQLAAGAGGRHRHLARADPASPLDRQLDARRHQAVEPVCPRQGAEARRRRHRLRLSLCRHPAARRRGGAHPQLSFHHAVPSDPPVALGLGDPLRRRAHLGADG